MSISKTISNILHNPEFRFLDQAQREDLISVLTLELIDLVMEYKPDVDALDEAKQTISLYYNNFPHAIEVSKASH